MVTTIYIVYKYRYSQGVSNTCKYFRIRDSAHNMDNIHLTSLLSQS